MRRARVRHFRACSPSISSFHRFEKSRVIGPLHTGGPLAVTPDGLQIVTCVGEEVVLTRVEDGVQICRFAGVGPAVFVSCTTAYLTDTNTGH